MKTLNKFTLTLDEGHYGFFETEWYNLYLKTKERKDLELNTKQAICGMYASMLIQLYEQSLEFYREIRDNNGYNDFYTKELVNRFINFYEKDIVRYKEEVKNMGTPQHHPSPNPINPTKEHY